MIMLILGLVVFLGVHSVRMVAREWRLAQVEAMGDRGWRGAYAIVSLIGFVLIWWGFARAWPEAPLLYEPPVFMKHIAAFLMLFAMLSLGVFILPPGRLKPALKHPMLLAVKIWAVAHLLANGDAASVLLFGTVLVWAVANRISVARRETPPPLPGPARNDALAVALGFVLFVLFVWKLHEWLIGVAPMG
jgi:uncharacterized membrane protein